MGFEHLNSASVSSSLLEISEHFSVAHEEAPIASLQLPTATDPTWSIWWLSKLRPGVGSPAETSSMHCTGILALSPHSGRPRPKCGFSLSDGLREVKSLPQGHTCLPPTASELLF